MNQSLQVTVDGNTNLLTTPQIITSEAGTTFVRYTYSFTADSSTSTVTFTDTSDTAGVSDGTDGVDGFLDNISVQYVSGSISSVTYIEDGVAVVLDADVQIFDAILSGIDDFNGATLTLVRNGGANSEDLFSATGNLVFNGGAIELSTTNIGSYTNAAGTLVLTFGASTTNAQVNEVIQSIAYENSNDTPPVNIKIDWTFDDGNTGNQGSGGALQVTGDTTVTITAVNDAPTLISFITVVDTTLEEAEVEITLAELKALGDEADADGTVDAFVAQSVSTGTLLIGTSSGTATAWASGSNDTIDATHHAYWTPATDATGTLNAFEVVAKDNLGAVSISNVVVQIASTAVGDTPTVADITTNEDTQSAAIVIDRNASDGTEVTHFKISGISNGTLTLSDGSTVVNEGDYITYAQGQAGLKFTGGLNSTSTGSFDVEASQNGTSVAAQSGKATSTITVNMVNDAPTITNGPLSTLALTEGDPAQTLTSTGIIADIDSTDFNTGNLTIYYSVTGDAGDQLSINHQGTATGQIGFDGTNVSYEGATIGTLHVTHNGANGNAFSIILNSNATQTALTALLNNITFQNTSDNPVTSRTLYVTINDGDGASRSALMRVVTVTATNDAPVNTVPVSITITEDIATTLTGISIAGVDAGSADMLVTLSVPTGSLVAVTGSGVTVGGTASALTLTGSIADINAFITASHVTYTTAANANGSVTLTVLTSDQGNIGSGGALTASDTVTLSITAVNDAPTFNTPNFTTPNFTTHTITTGADGAYSVTTADVDGDGDMDILSASQNDDKIAWYENDGSQNFTQRVITTAADGATSVTTADVDGDGSLDVLSASASDDKISWYENTAVTTLDGAPSFTEGGPAVVLDSDVIVSDDELDALNGGLGDYNDASVTLARNGGANSEDNFSNAGLLGTLTQGGSLVYNGTTIGTVTTNSSGTLVLTFNSNATSALVDSTLQSIAYSNNSLAPPVSVQVDWTFDDGNSGSQGAGGVLQAVGSYGINYGRQRCANGNQLKCRQILYRRYPTEPN